MSKQGFDARYPAMFQPGGEPGATPASSPPPTLVQAEMPAPSGTDMPIRPKPAPPMPALTGPGWAAGQIRKSPWVVWRGPMAFGAVLVVAAVFCFAAQYLAPVTVSLEQELVPNARNASWALALYPLATPLLTAGLSLLFFVMFMISRLSAERENRIRTCLGVFGAGLLICGVVAQFGRQIFPTPMGPVLVVDAETGMPSSYVLSLPLSLALPEIAPALLWVGLVVIAALVSVPRVWRFTETEGVTDDVDLVAHQAFSRARSIKAGALFAALAIAAGLAPQIFPSVAARSVAGEGGITMLQPWTETVTVLAPCLLAAGLTVLAVGVLSTTVRAALAGLTQEPPSDVEG